MMNSEVKDKSVRNYLLGKLSDETEMRQIEEKILLDDDFAETLAIAEEELIEQYLDDALDADEERNFNTHFLALPERRKKLNLTRNLRKYAARAESENRAEPVKKKTNFFDWRSLFAMPAVRFAAITLLFVSVGFAVWRTMIYESDVDKGLAQLRQAYRGQRPIEPRTSANLDYAPMPNTRGANAATADEKARSRAERYLLDANENPNDAAAHHALGLFYLAERKPDNALKEFDAALKLKPDDAKLLSDTGAAYLEKVKQSEIEEKGDEFFQNADDGLKNLNRALEINPNLTEALFNRALLLQKMRLTNQAREAWQKYLEKDSSSPWADEARKNLELLDQQSLAPKTKEQILQDFLEAYRNRNDARAWEIVSQTKELVTGIMVSQQLARKFLELETDESRKEEQTEILSAFLYLGELEKQKSGDLYFAELAEYYSKTNPAQRQKLLTAQDELQKGHSQILKADWSRALNSLEESQKLFISAGNNWESQVVEYQICYCLSRLDKILLSNKKLLMLVALGERQKYKWIQSLAYNWIGANFDLLGESSNALSYNRKLLNIAQETSDYYAVRRAFDQMAIQYRTIGNSEKAFESSFRGLSLEGSYNVFPRQQWRTISYTKDSCYRFKLYESAISLAKEELYLASNKLHDDWISFSVYKDLALINADIKKFGEGIEHLAAARQIAESFENKEMKQTLIGEFYLSMGNLLRQEEQCEQAIENYKAALGIYEKMEFSIYNYETQKGKLLCQIALNQDAAVRETMPVILRLFDEHRETINDELDQSEFFDKEQNIYDIATDYAYTKQKDSEQALNYAENSRARTLLHTIRKENSQPLKLNEILSKLPSEVQLVYYAVLNDKIIIWYISESKVAVAEKLIRSEELDEKINYYVKYLSENENQEELNRLGTEIYDLLIAPIENLLIKDKTLCIVPDKSLFRVPYSALLSPKTKRYLIEDYPLLFSPSATVLINETDIAAQKSTPDETILSIGNPAFSKSLYSELPDLPDAKQEAVISAGFYNSAKTFTGNDAGKKQLFENLGKSDVIHYAGHYVPNSRQPLKSVFLLADNSLDNETGDLSLEEITENKLLRTRLIILSACRTGVEKIWGGEGAFSAARIFLAADVPLVIATQWEVNSEATSQLMINFHRYRKRENLPTIAALRKAQIDLLRNNSPYRSPFYWAGFFSIGGFTKY